MLKLGTVRKFALYLQAENERQLRAWMIRGLCGERPIIL